MDNEKLAQLFIDGIGNINLSGGAVRAELISVTPNAQDEKNIKKIDRHMRVIMTPQGFIQAVTTLQNFLVQLEEKGIVKRAEPEEDKKKDKKDKK